MFIKKKKLLKRLGTRKVTRNMEKSVVNTERNMFWPEGLE